MSRIYFKHRGAREGISLMPALPAVQREGETWEREKGSALLMCQIAHEEQRTTNLLIFESRKGRLGIVLIYCM